MYLNYLLSFCVRFFRCATHTHTHTHTADTDLDAFVQKNARAIYIIYPPYPPIFDPQKWCKNRKIPMGRWSRHFFKVDFTPPLGPPPGPKKGGFGGGGGFTHPPWGNSVHGILPWEKMNFFSCVFFVFVSTHRHFAEPLMQEKNKKKAMPKTQKCKNCARSCVKVATV